MKLQAAQVQKLALTQSMRQSLTFLQLPAVDLSQAVQEAALSNPLLEVTEPDFGRVAVDVARPEEDPAPVFQESELWPRYAPPGAGRRRRQCRSGRRASPSIWRASWGPSPIWTPGCGSSAAISSAA